MKLMHCTAQHCSCKGFIQFLKNVCEMEVSGQEPWEKASYAQQSSCEQAGEHEWSPFTPSPRSPGTWSGPVMAPTMVQQITLSAAGLKAAPLPSRAPTPTLLPRASHREPEQGAAPDNNHSKERKFQKSNSCFHFFSWWGSFTHSSTGLTEVLSTAAAMSQESPETGTLPTFPPPENANTANYTSGWKLFPWKNKRTNKPQQKPNKFLPFHVISRTVMCFMLQNHRMVGVWRSSSPTLKTK